MAWAYWDRSVLKWAYKSSVLSPSSTGKILTSLLFKEEIFVSFNFVNKVVISELGRKMSSVSLYFGQWWNDVVSLDKCILYHVQKCSTSCKYYLVLSYDCLASYVHDDNVVF